MTQPLLKTQDLFQRIVALVQSDNRNEFDVAKLRREAEALAPHDAAGAAMALGTLAVVGFNESEVDGQFKKLLRMLPGDSAALSNYATALGVLMRFGEARSYAQQAYSIKSGNPAILDCLISETFFAGAFQEARKLLDRRLLLKLEAPHSLAERIEETIRVILDAELDDSQGIQLQEMATGVLRAHKAYARRVAVSVQNDEETRTVAVWYHLQLPVTKVVDLNDEFTYQLSGFNPPLVAAQHVVHLYVSDENP